MRQLDLQKHMLTQLGDKARNRSFGIAMVVCCTLFVGVYAYISDLKDTSEGFLQDSSQLGVVTGESLLDKTPFC